MGVDPQYIVTKRTSDERGMGYFFRSYKKIIASLFIAQAYLALLLVLDWHHGIERGAILGGLLLGLILLRFWPLASSGRDKTTTTLKHVWRPAKVLLIIILLLDLGVAGYACVRSVRSHQIPMDQGQMSWRAARLLWQGQDPYGLGALVDFFTFANRFDVRKSEGMTPLIPDANVDGALSEYDRTLDPGLREQLLPTASAGKNDLSEARFVGYRYGPLIIEMTALLVPLGLPASVVALNAVACFGMLWVMYRLMRGTQEDPTPAILGLLALLVDRHISWNYLNETATDVWALLFCSLGVLAFKSGRPLATAAAFAAALGCKIFPTLIFLPLLLQFRSVRPLAAFAVVTAAIYGPWLVWDTIGIMDNVFLWPMVVLNDTTSWVYFAPPDIALAVRLAALAGMFVLWFRYLTGRETRLFWTLAIANTLVLAVGSNLHNNYIPWASIWVVAAIVERFAEARNSGFHAAVGRNDIAGQTLYAARLGG